MSKNLCAINNKNKDLFKYVIHLRKKEKKEFGHQCLWHWHPNCTDGPG